MPSLSRLMPGLAGLSDYRARDLPSDAVAGTVVAIMLVPQAMAYALLAGLPPEVGLYASVLPVALYGLLGTSKTLAVGPVAIVSLLVAVGVSKVAEPGSSAYVAAALALALMVGLAQVAMGWLRLGFLVNFLSHAVLTGFTSAAALVIAMSQVKHLAGIDLPRAETLVDSMRDFVARAVDSNMPTLLLSLGVLLSLLAFGRYGKGLFRRLGATEARSRVMARTGPFVVVVGGLVATSLWALDVEHGVAVVGAIPRGLPSWTWPALDAELMESLLPTALAISFVGFLESFAVAKSLAARRREKIDANKELVALGVANLGAAASGGYPVTGGLSRSLVNFTAGARTGAASLITAALVALCLAFLTPLFGRLPKAVLAAIIVVAVLQLVEVTALGRFWRYSKADALAFGATFLAVLVRGIEVGIVVGVVVALVLHLWRTTRPHMAVIGRVGDSEHFRNVKRHPVKTWPHLLLVRVDESLFFGNAQFLEEQMLKAVADRPGVRDVVLVGSAVNFIDMSALEILEGLATDLHSSGVTLHLAEIKGPVMDRLERTDFLERLKPGRVFLSTQQAVDALGGETASLSPTTIPDPQGAIASVEAR